MSCSDPVIQDARRLDSPSRYRFSYRIQHIGVQLLVKKKLNAYFLFRIPFTTLRTMKLEQSFEVTAAASEIETRIVAFMQRNGYQPNPASKQSYMRGSRVGSFLSFSPRKWRTNAQVTETQLSGSNWRVTLMLDINDDGQLVTQHERLYWKAELDDFQRAVQTGEIAVEGLAEQERALVSGGLKGLLIFLFTGLFVAMIVSIVIVKLNSHLGGWAIIAGAFTGALAGLLAAKRHWGF